MKKNLTLVFFSTIFAILLALLIDRCVGLFLVAEDDLVFGRYSTFNYSTPEFQAEARINNLGFRGRDSPIQKKSRYRIMALGDSFTFGWGVDIEESWPKVLERNLQRLDLDVEIVNLGKPGGSPGTYADIAEKAIPMLKPDLVVIAMLQGDDLAQAINNLTQSEETTKTQLTQGSKPPVGRGEIYKIIKPLFPNFITLRSRAFALIPAKIEQSEAIWRVSVEGFVAGLSNEKKKKFDQIDIEIKEKFLRGELNPGMLGIGLRHSEYLQETLDLANSKVQRAIQRITAQLVRIKIKADRINCKVVVISTPTGAFTSAVNGENYRRMGINTNVNFLQTTAMDEALRAAALAANVDIFDVTRQFRDKASERPLFFEYDGHFNVSGQKFYAESIEKFIIKQLVTDEDSPLHE